MAIKRPPPVQSPGLQPVARPVRVEGSPAPPNLAPNAGASDLLELSKHLAPWSQSLAQFGMAYGRHQDKAGEAAALGLALKTPARDLNDRIKRGDVGPEVNRAVLDMKNGEHMARLHSEDMRRRYLGENTSADPSVNNAFDRDKGDLRTWYAEASREKFAEVAPTHATRSSYAKGMMAFERQLSQEQDAYLQQRTKAANVDSAWRDQYGVAVDQIGKGEFDPKKIADAVHASSATTAALHRLTRPEMNEASIRVAQAIATQGVPGRPDLAPKIVQELLLSKRGGIGSIGETAQYADRTQKLIELARRTADTQQAELSQELSIGGEL